MNWRMAVTVSLFLLAIVVVVSGVVLYVGPPGSLKTAKVLGLTRSQWSDLHTVSALATAGLLVVHIWLNRRALIMYFKRFGAAEAAVALAITALFVVTPIINAPPASWILEASNGLEASWLHGYKGAKGFGFMTLEEFCKQYGVPLQEALKYLGSASPNEYLRDIAERLGTTPAALAQKLLKLKQTAEQRAVTTTVPTSVAQTGSPQRGQGGGYGMLTLEEFCKQYGIPLEEVLNYLATKYGFQASPTMTIRDVAFSIGLRPYELVQELMSLR